LELASVVRAALEEDIGAGDITTLAVVPEGLDVEARIVAGEPLVVAVLEAAREVFAQLDARVEFSPEVADGTAVEGGRVLVRLHGPARPILTGERTALNFLQHLSGIASLTRRYVQVLQPTKTRLKDTRKTTPGLRRLEKYAVRCGGGLNHRQGLYDGVLIKDNHLAVVGGLREAVRRARKQAPGRRIEVEVEDLAQVREALELGVEALLLDNMPLEMLRQAVELASGRAEIEVSGGVVLERLEELARWGVDYVSVGAITHSAPAVDISLEIDPRFPKEGQKESWPSDHVRG